MTTSIQLMNTLDKFSSRELAELSKLLHAYANAGSYAANPDDPSERKFYAYLPESWIDADVYPDFDPVSGQVFLTNSNGQMLANTDYGLMMQHAPSFATYTGTIFELAYQINDSLTFVTGDTLKNGSDSLRFHLNEIYSYLDADADALQYTDADLTDLYRAKERIAYAFILSSVEQVFNEFKASNKDYKLQLRCSYHEPTNDSGWYEDELAPKFLADCLRLSGFDSDIKDTDDQNRYAESIRHMMLGLDAEQARCL